MMRKVETYSDIRRGAVQRLLQAGIEGAGQEARLMLEAACGKTHADLIISGDKPAEPAAALAIDDIVTRRVGGEPLDHILGTRSFYGRDFKVTKDVLSPRPETELLVERALSSLKDIAAPKLLDLGTGSGAIIISLLLELPNASGVGSDVSVAALDVAKANADSLGASDRLTLIKSYWFENVTGTFDLIVSNPPYIESAELPALMPEVRNFDPMLALDGGKDGLDAYRTILAEAPNYLRADGRLMFEIGYNQGASVSTLARDAGYRDINIYKDLAGHDRVVTMRSFEV